MASVLLASCFRRWRHPPWGACRERRASLVASLSRWVLLGLVIALVTAAGAAAALTPRFNRTSASVGQLVTIYQPGGLDWLKGDRRPIRVYLVPASIAGRIAFRADGTSRVGPPRSRRSVYVGRMTIAAGRLRFRLPKLAPGRYAALLWCGPCGGTLIGSVTEDVPADVTVRPDGSLLRVRRSR
jgi:hypothetical protein